MLALSRIVPLRVWHWHRSTRLGCRTVFGPFPYRPLDASAGFSRRIIQRLIIRASRSLASLLPGEFFIPTGKAYLRTAANDSAINQRTKSASTKPERPEYRPSKIRTSDENMPPEITLTRVPDGIAQIKPAAPILSAPILSFALARALIRSNASDEHATRTSPSPETERVASSPVPLWWPRLSWGRKRPITNKIPTIIAILILRLLDMNHVRSEAMGWSALAVAGDSGCGGG